MTPTTVLRIVLGIGIYCVCRSENVAADANNCSDRKVVMCYWASWAVYRSGRGNHTIDHIDPAYCTHVIYSFAGLNMAGSIDALDFTSDIAKGISVQVRVPLTKKPMWMRNNK